MSSLEHSSYLRLHLPIPLDYRHSFNIPRIKNLTGNPLKHKPAVNQVELNYFNPQPELLQWAKENDLLLEAYSPLGSTRQVKEALNVPEVKAIAHKLGITPAQVLISWHVQRGVSGYWTLLGHWWQLLI